MTDRQNLAEPSDRALIAVRGLVWRYAPVVDGGAPVTGLDGVNLTIRAGESVGVVGPTGAGKSTLLMALTGVIPELADGEMTGSVTVDGCDTARTGVADLSTRVGYVQQDPESQLFCASVADEIAFPLEQRGMDPSLMDRRIDAMLRLVGLEGLADRAPTSLSGGQMQRVAIAAALAGDPDILILDEPTAALDPDGRREVFAALGRIRAERARAGRRLTVVLAEQDTDHLSHWADRVFVLDRGRIVCDAGPEIFARQAALLERLGVALPSPQPQLRVMPQSAADAVSEPAIAADRLTYRYAGLAPDVPPALSNVNVAIARGSFVGLVGPNGSGKTTFARHLNGLLKPSDGHVSVDGIDTRTQSVGRLARHVGYAFQNPDHQIFCASTREEIAFGARALGRPADATDAAVDRLLDLFGLRDVADASPATLGYGDRRAVALASVLAMDTDVLVLDEPTAGLDRRRSARLLDAVSERNAQGTTVIMISHDMRAVAERCTHLLRLEHGRLAEWGRIDHGR